MKRNAVIAAHALLLVPGLAAAGSLDAAGTRPAGPTLAVDLGYRHGSTSEELAATIGDVTGSSRLDWPASYVFLGVRGSLPLGPRINLRAELGTNLTEPATKMEDSDWIEAPASGLPRTLFSFTESKTTSRTLIADLGIEQARGDRAALVAGYRHEYVGATAHGARGWQLDPTTGGRAEVELDERLVGGRFDAHRMMPYVGGRYRDLVEGRVLLVYARDHDDHVYRGKQGDGVAYGAGISLAARPRWAVSRTLSIGLDVALELLYAGGGDLEQSVYRDDPTTEEDERDTAIPDARYSSRTLMVGGGLVLEASL